MQIVADNHPITAIVYGDGPEFETFLKTTTESMAGQGMRLAGLIQESRPRDERRKCDIYLKDLATGEVHGVSDDRGPEARGCLLNTDRLLRAGETAAQSLSAETDLLVLCKFGKTEATGGGLRSLIATALDLDVPVLIGVPRANLEPFRAFAGDTAHEVDLAELGRPEPEAA
jgi:nucleoside-triphosphatase THEP1